MHKTDFASAFANVVSNDAERREARINEIVSTYEDDHAFTKQDAIIIDEAVCAGIRESFRAVGKALDGLNPQLQVDAMPMLMDFFAKNAMMLEQYVMAIVFGAARPTPGCDCEACRIMKYVHSQMNISETNVRAVEKQS